MAQFYFKINTINSLFFCLIIVNNLTLKNVEYRGVYKNKYGEADYVKENDFNGESQVNDENEDKNFGSIERIKKILKKEEVNFDEKKIQNITKSIGESKKNYLSKKKSIKKHHDMKNNTFSKKPINKTRIKNLKELEKITYKEEKDEEKMIKNNRKHEEKIIKALKYYDKVLKRKNTQMEKKIKEEKIKKEKKKKFELSLKSPLFYDSFKYDLELRSDDALNYYKSSNLPVNNSTSGSINKKFMLVNCSVEVKEINKSIHVNQKKNSKIKFNKKNPIIKPKKVALMNNISKANKTNKMKNKRSSEMKEIYRYFDESARNETQINNHTKNITHNTTNNKLSKKILKEKKPKDNLKIANKKIATLKNNEVIIVNKADHLDLKEFKKFQNHIEKIVPHQFLRQDPNDDILTKLDKNTLIIARDPSKINNFIKVDKIRKRLENEKLEKFRSPDINKILGKKVEEYAN